VDRDRTAAAHVRARLIFAVETPDCVYPDPADRVGASPFSILGFFSAASDRKSAMPKYLVVYYSWTGNTAKVAKLIAVTLGADIEEIREAKPRRGFFAFTASLVASVLKRSPPILESIKNVVDYDIVILGCPVWGANMATPMRAYLTREGPRTKEIALFCTLGGSGGKATLARMAALCERTSLADLALNQPAIASDAWRSSVELFARQIQKSDATPSDRAAA
jgi:flavodoxin